MGEMIIIAHGGKDVQDDCLDCLPEEHRGVLAVTPEYALYLVATEEPVVLLADKSHKWAIKHAIDRNIPTIVLTSYGEIESAVGAIKRGAYDFATLPINKETLRETIQKSLKEKNNE